MAEIVYSEASDGRFGSGQQTSFSNARGSVLTSSPVGAFSHTTSNFQFGIYNIYSAGRGGSLFSIVRSYFAFDLSGLSGTATSAELYIYSDNLGTNATDEKTIHLVESTALTSGAADFGNCFSGGTTLGTGMGTIVTSTTAGYHSNNLNTAGLAELNNAVGSGTLTIGALGHYDRNNTAPSLGGNFVKIHIYYSEYSGTSRDPYLEITFPGYTHKVLGVAAASIGKINGVSIGDIEKVNGV